MCKTPKAPKAAPSVIDTKQAVQDEMVRRRKQRGFLSTYRQGTRGDTSSAPVAVKALTGE